MYVSLSSTYETFFQGGGFNGMTRWLEKFRLISRRLRFVSTARGSDRERQCAENYIK